MNFELSLKNFSLILHSNFGRLGCSDGNLWNIINLDGFVIELILKLLSTFTIFERYLMANSLFKVVQITLVFYFYRRIIYWRKVLIWSIYMKIKSISKLLFFLLRLYVFGINVLLRSLFHQNLGMGWVHAQLLLKLKLLIEILIHHDWFWFSRVNDTSFNWFLVKLLTNTLVYFLHTNISKVIIRFFTCWGASWMMRTYTASPLNSCFSSILYNL